ncbi:FUSC family protein [Georgenia sp. SYP-B2076]|uniref:FUSC family protein n=1 Tax=Georgenia sp. SYP-B2076 TaxID=2495881 RepID=UPI000F8F42CB|nr:FUSC family protein [Georgenia sp. SYP-B2076]
MTERTVGGLQDLRESVRTLAWPTAARASMAIGVPLVALTLAGRHDVGLMASTGAFTVLFGRGQPLRYRVRLLLAVAVGLVLSSALGALTAGVGWAAIVLLTLIGAVSTFLTLALRTGPPGGFFFVMVAGVAGFIPAQGTVSPATMIAATAIGAGCAVPIALADLLLNPVGPQQRAVAAARSAVERYLRADRYSAEAPGLSRAAAAALHHAWGVLWAAGDSTSRRPGARARVAELQVAHQEYASRMLPGTSPDPDLAADQAESPLGLPTTGRLVDRGLRYPTVPLDAAARVSLGIVVAGLIALAIGTDHMYWAMMIAALVLYQGLDRRRSLARARNRLVGTVIGLGIFAVINLAEPSQWVTVAILIVLQGGIELAVPRNYAVAVCMITPLALTIGTAGGGADVRMIISERLLDTLVGLAVAVLVLFTVGRNSSVPILGTYVKRVLRSCGDALDHIGAGTVGTAAGRRAQLELALDMQDLAHVAARAISDDPLWGAPWVESRQATAWLGLTVLARCAAARGPADGVGGASWACWALASQASHGTPPDPVSLHTVRAVIH